MRAWLRSCGILLHWRILVRRREIAWIIVLQALVSMGTIIGLGFMQPDVDRSTALFIVTGAGTLNVAMAGLVSVPQELASAKERGSLQYMLGLPIPRLTLLVADLVNVMLWTLPGVVAALAIGGLRYGFSYNLSPLLPIALALTALTGGAVGYALALVSPSPGLTRLLSQVVIFGLFLFSPLLYPDDRMPAVMRWAHAVLPVRHMADAVRGTLTNLGGAPLGHSLIVLAMWAAGSVVVASMALQRRA